MTLSNIDTMGVDDSLIPELNEFLHDPMDRRSLFMCGYVVTKELKCFRHFDTTLAEDSAQDD
jgi:hypothetical protein